MTALDATSALQASIATYQKPGINMTGVMSRMAAIELHTKTDAALQLEQALTFFT